MKLLAGVRHLSIYLSLSIYIYIYVYICMCIYVYVCMYVCVCMCIYIYIYAHMHMDVTGARHAQRHAGSAPRGRLRRGGRGGPRPLRVEYDMT